MAEEKKYYAVKVGNFPGIFNSWEECQVAIAGFRRAVFKTFTSLDEAKAYLNDVDLFFATHIAPRLLKNQVVAFIDGSFDVDQGRYGWGAYIILPDKAEHLELANFGDTKRYLEGRNVTGEILGALNAIDWARRNGYDNICIFYDYAGIEKWADGEWKRNTELSIYYHRYVNEKRQGMTIEFYKVKGHSNNKYNDLADKLAKRAVFEGLVKKK